VAALSQCHLLWYLHVCSAGGVVVTDYVDDASGVMVETADGGGSFREVVLRPVATVAEEGMVETALELHARASALCFIAASVNFPVRHEPRVLVAAGAAGSGPTGDAVGDGGSPVERAQARLGGPA
jgi:organic hydroperoxide reductase OsmC/OhrA